MTENGFSCFLIGGDTLLVQCAEILRDKGHEIRGVVTAAPAIIQWCAENDVRVIDVQADYVAAMSEEPFDYLFAITHLAIIPTEALALPRKMAVNFHDGPLPRYAGLNTPVWALINREPEYGISWHVMTAGVDKGDLLKQVLFEVTPEETALSLNTRCMGAAVESFPDLIAELAEDRQTLSAQDGSLRSYFGKFDRPQAACTIDWQTTAEEVDAFVRALTFGPYPNPVGAAKTAADDEGARPFIVTAVEVSGSEQAEPGEVVSVSAQAVVVGTGSGAVSITGVSSTSGAEIALDELGLSKGDRLGPSQAVSSRLTELDSELCRHEQFWTRRLHAAQAPDVPHAAGPVEGDPDWHRLDIEIPETIRSTYGDRAGAAAVAAFGFYLARTGRREAFQIAIANDAVRASYEGVESYYSATVPMSFDLDAAWTIGEAVSATGQELEVLSTKRGYLRDVVARSPGLGEVNGVSTGMSLSVGLAFGDVDRHSATPPGEVLSLIIDGDARAALVFDRARISDADAEVIRSSFVTCLQGVAGGEGARWVDVPLVSNEALEELSGWNATAVPFDADQCVHDAFSAQVDRTPDATAVVFEGDSVTYRELDERANGLARHLQKLGVGPDDLVGVNVERSVDLMVATLGVMKAGGAYLPLDPHFPAERLSLMIADSGARVLITQSHLEAALPPSEAEVVRLDVDWERIAAEGTDRPTSAALPTNLAYAIYTSGSTGTPKGVLIEHRNVANFFTGMDAVVHHDPPGVWLAVTSLSFDISVLELFWTLARGFEVVLFSDAHRIAQSGDAAARAIAASRGMQFGLFMWGNDDGPGPDKYRLMLDGARFFDENGFDSVWTPERHFHAFGGPFPNPSVTSAALAAITENVGIRSGSCVSPLHHPIRVAEEWAVVDNLSNGRVGLSFAAGWQPNDFILRPESFPGQKQVMMDQIETVRRLWRGEEVEFENPMGDMVGVTTLPRPVQPELPFWVTTAGNPESYRVAGAMGANVLTHLLGQSLSEVADKIAIYREARAEAGFDPATGVVTLMLHAFVGQDDDEVREIVRQPMKDYLGASMKLVLGFAWTFPAFKRPGGPDSKPEDLDLSALSDEDTEAILDFAFERYYETSGLFGTAETCGRMVDACKVIDVDEIACLLDFGVDTDLVMESLPGLKVVRDAANQVSADETQSVTDHSFAAQIQRHGVTHLQCTPSMARLLVADPDSKKALGEVQHLMIGGEAFPAPLAAELEGASEATITNMYGPTETTIWSSTQAIEGATDPIPIGRPLANTQLHVLDPYLRPVPAGVPGELHIGGDGVARGYHQRADLTEARFVSDPFGPAGARMYRTGDLACFRRDGTLDFLGRIDHQVKIRGHRIELGEIEATVDAHESVRTSAVVLREDEPGDQRLVAYYVSDGSGDAEVGLRDHLRNLLPEYMVPGHYVALDRMPLTPNGKIDRGALPAPMAGNGTAVLVEPETGLERTIAECWQSVLKLDRVGVDENFFDIGGHSLLIVQLHRELSEATDRPISLVDLYRFPTVRALGDHLSADAPGADLEQSEARAEKRKAGLAARRRRRG